jgi:hypothetical protein
VSPEIAQGQQKPLSFRSPARLWRLAWKLMRCGCFQKKGGYIIGAKGDPIMTTLTFDTLQFVQRLTQAGVKEPQAVAIAEAVRDLQATSDMVTKQDLLNSEAKLEARIVQIKADLEVKMAENKSDLVRWVVSVGVLQSALIGALLLKLIPS